MKKLVVVALLAVAMLAAYSAGAQAPVVVTGENVGLLKTVASAEAANASTACVLNVLKVAEAKGADGKPIADLAGKILYYLPTKSAEAVMLGDKMQGKKVTVTGKLFKAECALLVEKAEEAAAAAPAAAAPAAPAKPAAGAAPAAPGAKPAAPAGGKKDDFEDIPVKSKSGLQVL
jgi:hypothetical protein